MSASSRTRRNYKDSRAASANRLYPVEEVLSLYGGVSRNTLGHRCRLGLPFIEGNPRLFLGDDLNAFHRWRKLVAKRPCGPDEVYCFSCKQHHSLRDIPFETERRDRHRVWVKITCPETEVETPTFLGIAKFERLTAPSQFESTPESHDYDVSSVQGESVQKPEPVPEVFSRTLLPENAWAVHAYQIQLQEAQGLHDKTIKAKLRHILRFVRFLDRMRFSDLTPEIIQTYKRTLVLSEDAEGTPESDEEAIRRLSASTIVHELGDLKAFVGWLASQTGYRSLNPDLADYFSPPNRLFKLAQISGDTYGPTLDEIRAILTAMPSTTLAQRRDRAALAFASLTGVRDGALVTLRLKHVRLARREVFQDALKVNTKGSKTMTTFWFPVGEDMEAIVTDWVEERIAGGADGDEPLFPKTPSAVRKRGAPPRPEFLKSATEVRKLIKRKSAVADIPDFREHTIRTTIARMFDTWARTPKEYKALSQNLGHEHVRTTLEHYGKLDTETQGAVIEDIRNRKDEPELATMFENWQKTLDEMRTTLGGFSAR
ncbi:site-specific integrase [Breoghania sp.]|uniref:tyrosine-type recombinase/integrase n=1 Tax=Breoghania sp. TaxID=2065378 RepID=UPI002AA62DDD|nr:site-specific integrase [Breoghania sp.]